MKSKSQVRTHQSFSPKNLEELKGIINEVVKSFSNKQIVLLNGPMGAGKTQIVQFIVEALGGKASQSPTYTIHHAYRLTNQKIDHLDLYRIKSEGDLEATGFWDILDSQQGLVLIEWADRLSGEWWPKDWAVAQFDIKDDHSFMINTLAVLSSHQKP